LASCRISLAEMRAAFSKSLRRIDARLIGGMSWQR
jgi:hypothetical protein